jgi:hypothetical protein
VRTSDGHPTGRGVPIYCPYWGRGCNWSSDTTGQTGQRYLEQHLAGERKRGSTVHLQPEKKAA